MELFNEIFIEIEDADGATYIFTWLLDDTSCIMKVSENVILEIIQ